MIDHDSKCIMLQGQFSAIPLHNACIRGHYNVVKVLMEHEPECQLIAETGHHHQTPLHLAAKYGHVKVVELLLEICSQLKIELKSLKNDFHQTPVHIAAFNGKTE